MSWGGIVRSTIRCSAVYKDMALSKITARPVIGRTIARAGENGGLLGAPNTVDSGELRAVSGQTSVDSYSFSDRM